MEKLDSENIHEIVLKINEIIERINQGDKNIPKMVRPDFEQISKMRGYIACSCGATLQTLEQNRTHWQAGHFDIVKKIDV